MTGASPLNPTNCYKSLYEFVGFNGASPVTTIRRDATVWLATHQCIVVTGLAPVMLPATIRKDTSHENITTGIRRPYR